MLLDYESCCTEKWLVSYYDTNHFWPMWSCKSQWYLLVV